MTTKSWKYTKGNSLTLGLRIEKRVLEGIKRIAANEGLPYQTLIKSVLFKFVKSKGELKEIEEKSRAVR